MPMSRAVSSSRLLAEDHLHGQTHPTTRNPVHKPPLNPILPQPCAQFLRTPVSDLRTNQTCWLYSYLE